MADTVEVKTPSEFLQLLEESRILDADQLRVVRDMLPETPTSRMLARRLVAKGLLTRWQAGQLLVGWSKLRLGNHRLRGQIGRGEYGRVFLAEHIQLKREVAIKTLSRRFTQRREIVDRFLEDARQVAALDHRNLVHVLDIDSDDDQYFMVMEYVTGRDLRRRVAENGPLPCWEAAGYLAQAADGLAHAHALGVIHRDLRPENLMLDDKGVIKILGLGVGRLAANSRSLTDPGTPDGGSGDGVFDYRSPEQCRGEIQGDVRSDIFSLGAIAHFLLTGRPPRQASADDGQGRVTLAEEVDLAHLQPGMPPSLAAIVARMLAVDPAYRFDSARVVSQACREWLAGEAGEPLSSVPELGQPVATGSLRATAVPPPIPTGLDPTEADAPWRELGASAVPPVGPPAGESAALMPRRSNLLASRYALGLAALAALGLVLAAAYIWWPDGQAEVVMLTGTPAVAEAKPSAPKLRPRRPPERSTGAAPGGQLSDGQDAGGGESQPASGAAEEGVGEPASATESPDTAVPPAPPAAKTDSDAAKTAPSPIPPNPPLDPTKPPAETATAVPPAAENPLQNLPAAVDLPELSGLAADGGPTESLLAPLDTSAKDVSLVLLGGEHAAGKAGQFVMQAATADEPGCWRIDLIDARDANVRQAIGQLRLHDGHLQFRWEPAAAAHVFASHLCNCVVRINVPGHTHDLRLRTAQQVTPLMVDLTRPEITERWPLKAPPDAQSTRFIVTRLEPPFPAAHTLAPATPIVADNEKTVALFGADPSEQVLLLELAPQLKTAFRLECKAFFQLNPKLDRIPLTSKKLETATTFVANRQVQHNLMAQQLRTALTQVPPTDPRHPQLSQSLQQAEAELAETSQATGRLTALADIRPALAAGAAIHFRLYYLADDCEVDLLRSGPTAE